MEDVRRADELEKLVSELSWLKRLASALVRDESDANDLVQETWLVAAEHAPTDGRPLRPWLGRVALNLVRMRSRAAKRRRAREVAVPAAERSPAPDELVGRLRAQRIVADEILRLAEPYRNTILLHYFEDLSSAEIARRAGIPEGTVRRRLKVARDELRSRLHAEERKTGQAIVGALAPLTIKQSAASTALGVVLVKKIIAVAVVLVGLFLVGSQLVTHAPPTASTVQAGATPARARAVPIASTVRIVVVVTDAAGPVGAARVRCAGADGEVLVIETATDGTAVAEVVAGPWSISASADGHVPAATTLDVSNPARIELELAVGGQTLTGTVTDMTGGVIAGARIDAARLDQTRQAIAVAFSDDAGRYKLAVGAGTILVAASHPAYAAQTRHVDLGSSATANFALVPGGTIDGVVTDLQTGEPVGGAVVRATSDAPALELADVNERVVIAGRDGKFRFAGLRPGGYALVARAGNRSSRTPVGVGVGVAEQQADIVVAIGATATIRGTVVDDSGAAAAVTIHARGDGIEGGATSDATGAFVLEGLPPGRWSLRGTSDRYLADGGSIVQLATTDVDGIVVRVRRGFTVRGHVEPRKVCDVEIAKVERGDAIPHHARATSNADGSFQLAPFGAGDATLTARCPSGEHGTLAITVTSDELVIPISPGGAIAGRVVDEAGKPLASVTVSAEAGDDATRIENGAVVSGLQVVTSTAGTFELRGLGAATYRLAVLDAGRPIKPLKTVKVALTPGQRASGIEVVVERPTGTIRGVVTGPDGAPVADAWVAIHQTATDEIAAMRANDDTEPQRFWMRDGGTEGRDPPPALTDAAGRFTLTNLLRGRYQVVAEARAGKLRGGAVDVTTDAQISLRLASVGSLGGTVRGPRGPTELFTVRLTGPIRSVASKDKFAFPPPTTPLVQARSFTGGAFAFPRLEAGDYALDVESVDGTGSAKVRVSSGQASVDILLVANGTVTGRLVDSAGKPLSGIGVALIPDQPPGQLQIAIHQQPVTSGPDGRFQVDGAPGTRTLAILGNAAMAKRGLVIAPNQKLDVGDVTVEALVK